MDSVTYFKEYFDELSVGLNQANIDDLVRISAMAVAANAQSKKTILVGNGGSAAMASHVAVDLVKAAGIRAINFNEADLITCFANDFGYEHWVEKALEFYADKGDLVILISSSGQSQNIINGARKALEMELDLITLSGFRSDNPLRSLGEINLWIDNDSYNHVEMAHHIWLVAIVDYIIAAR
jgi:D-sedoheptulose 7-phosphate isomerase